MVPDLQFLQRGILQLAEAIECIGGQLGNRGERLLALEAALLLDRITTDHADAFEGNHWWKDNRLPGWLGYNVNPWLNTAMTKTGQGTPNYLYAGLDHFKKTIAADPLVREYVAGK